MQTLTKEIEAFFKEAPRGFLRGQEIANRFNVKKPVLRVLLHRLHRAKRIVHLGAGYYAHAPTRVDWEQFACTYRFPSYLSLEYALSLYGILSQVPQTLTLVTSQRTSRFMNPYCTIEYSHLQPSLFFGYFVRGHTLMATPEKALLDMLYLVSLKKRRINQEELSLSRLDAKRLKQLAKRYPSRTQTLLRNLRGELPII